MKNDSLADDLKPFASKPETCLGPLYDGSWEKALDILFLGLSQSKCVTCGKRGVGKEVISLGKTLVHIQGFVSAK